MEFNGTAIYEDRLKCLDSEAMQGRCAVQHDRVVFDDDLKGVPDLILGALHHLTGGLDVSGNTGLHQTLHDEGLEELKCHLLRETALIHLEFRTYDDNRTAGVVDTFTEEVLTETSLFTLQHVGEGFQRTVVGSGDRAATAAVVDQGVDSLLQHALLIADDDVRCAEFQESLQTVVPVDDAAIQVIQV